MSKLYQEIFPTHLANCVQPPFQSFQDIPACSCTKCFPDKCRDRRTRANAIRRWERRKIQAILRRINLRPPPAPVHPNL